MERIFFPLIALGIVASVVFVQEGQRRIPIQYAKRMVGRRMTSGGTTYLPLRVNMAGVIPVIFAAAVLAFPPTMAQYFPATQDFVNTYFQPGDWLYLVIEGGMIVVFTFFYTAVQFNPVDQADNLRKHSRLHPRHPARPADRAVPRPRPHAADAARVAVPGGGRDRAEPLHPLRRVLPGDLARTGRYLRADRRRRRAGHDAPDGVADDDAQLRGVPPLMPRGAAVGGAGRIPPLAASGGGS